MMQRLFREALRAFGHQTWVSEKVRYRVLMRLYDPERVPAYPFEVDFFGMRYRGDLSSFLDWHVYFFGAYEIDELRFLQGLLERHDPGGVFIDIGANVGQHSMFMAKYAREVHAFEPWERVRASLDEKVSLNGLVNVRVHPVALGVRDELLPYYAPQGANNATGSFSPLHATDRNRHFGSLKVVNGDEYFAQQGINSVSLLKIDVEGWEKNVLLGLQGVIERCRPVVFMEYTATTRNSFDGPQEFRSCVPLDYDVYSIRMHQADPTLAPFSFDEAPMNVVLLPLTAASRKLTN